MIIALDVGERRIGIARSDPSATLATPVGTIARGSLADVAEQVRAQSGAEPIELVLIGFPRNMDGTYGPQAEKMKQFAETIGPALGAPTVLWDERLTSVAADEVLAARGVPWQERRGRNDAIAAAILLQEYLDHRSRP